MVLLINGAEECIHCSNYPYTAQQVQWCQHYFVAVIILSPSFYYSSNKGLTIISESLLKNLYTCSLQRKR